MKTIAAITVFASLVIAIQLSAQEEPSANTSRIRYSVTKLDTLGGNLSVGGGINKRGWVVGDANVAGNANEHATLWQEGVITDLGTLGGPNGGAAVVNARGEIAGPAQILIADPLGEYWGLNFSCDASGTPCQGWQYLVRGFLRQDGVMHPLPTLGGNNSWALGLNNRGQVAGYAENGTYDPNCVPPQVLDVKPVVWGPEPDDIQELSVLPGDSVAAAVAINDHGQAVGTSGACGSPSPLAHAVLWQNGSATNLGNLGGAMSNIAWSINNREQVVGSSDLPGDTITHAFLWQNGEMTDLGTLPGDVVSFASEINDNGQVVGQSVDQNGNPRAFLWRNGTMTDLNTLIAPSSLYLLSANAINSQGDIVGYAFDQDSSEVLGFLATPCDEELADNQACNDDSQGTTTATERHQIILPENVREKMRQRKGFGGFGLGTVRPQ